MLFRSVHSAIAPAFLDRIAARWGAKVTFIGDGRACALLSGHGAPVEAATPETWKTEHLALRVGVRIVDSMEDAIAHIEEHGSHHSDAILTENYSNAMRFVDEVD